MGREILGRLGVAAVASLALAGAGSDASAQSSLGMPFIGNNHLSFYSTALSTDGVASATSALYGGRYGRRFGSEGAATRFSVAIQGAARSLSDGNEGVADVSVTAALTRSMVEVDPKLSVSVAAGMGALAWGFDHQDTGIAHLSTPISAGLAYDIRIGSATFSPFVSPSVARYDNRTYVDDVRTSRDEGWDARVVWGASLSLKEVVLTTSGIRGEPGLPHRSRWAFAAGISF
ncbi:MAG: hypothetical protein AMXMBFR53_01070 [Gemmatimonadota bacterium]